MYGLLGHRLGHSYSSVIHRELGLEYGLFSVEPEDVERFVKGSEHGFNVTIPYKQTVIPYLDQLDEVAREIGAVNTVKMVGDKRIGYNTDWMGFRFIIERVGIDMQDAKVLILGSGGTSKTADYVARLMGAREIIKVSRSGETNYSNVYSHSDADVIVNTTPVGMYPSTEGCPIDIEKFDRLRGVVDVIYNPLRTNLLTRAMERGIPSTGGLGMLVAQAKFAEEIWFDRVIPSTEVDRIEQKLVSTVENIVLVGMPGSGKSTIGRALARRLGRDFVDTDTEIERTTGRTIPDIIAESVDHFRDIESEIVSEICSRNGLVVATGGGAVLRTENTLAMRRNGRVVRLVRDIEELATEGRPLSGGEDALRRMYTERAPLYEAVSDIEVRVIGVEETATRILEVLHEDFGY